MRTALGLVALAALPAGGCEGLIGIRGATGLGAAGDEPDGGAELRGDASAGGEDAQIDAAPPIRTLRFEHVDVPCGSDTVHQVALARSEPGSLHDRAVMALDQDSLWVCPQPFGDEPPEQIPIDAQQAQAMWVGDLTGNGTDDAVIVTESRVYYVTFEPSGDWTPGSLPTETTGGNGQPFVTGADLDGNGFTDVIVARDTIAVIFQDVEGFFEQPGDFLFPAEDAVFASIESPLRPDYIGLAFGEIAMEVVVRLAGEDGPPYQVERRQEVARASDAIAAVTDSDGLLSYVAVTTAEGLAFLPNEGDTLGPPDYVDADLGAPLATGDLTGDGVDEIVGVRHSDGLLGIFVSEPYEHEPPVLESGPRSFAIADVDGDGLADILVAGATGVYLLRQAE